jgi:two-component system, LytTR family, response regulator LytT
MTPSAKLRTLVIDDEWPARNYLVELLEGSGLAEVVGAVSNLKQAEQALAELPIDVAFVDIQLAGSGNAAGLEFVRARDATRGPLYVMATAFKEHALDAFELGAADYLVKPFTEERVEQCLNRLRARRPAEHLRPLRIVARRGRSLVFVDPDQILAFEASGRMTFVHTAHGKFDLDLSLAAIAASFGQTFTRVHRSWLVNAAQIRELEREGHESRLLLGTPPGSQEATLVVPVARERSQAVRDLLLSNAMGLRRS